jgi:hypothetical protein
VAWGGSSLLEDSCSDSLVHTPAGLQQQQRHMQVVLGVIVITNILYRS